MSVKTSPEFKLENLPIDELLVDHDYQRDYEPTEARKLADKWDWNKFVPAYGNRRNGHVYLTDGQTRVGALKILGYKGSVPVVTRSGLSIEEEAAQFLAQDDRKNISLIQKHKARLVEKDPTAVGVQKVLDQVGIEIHRNAGPNRTKSPAELYRTYREYGAEVLSKTLETIREHWGPEQFGMAEIRAIGRLYGNASPRFDEARFKKVLSQYTHYEWLLAATGLEAGARPNLGDSLWRAITSEYNKRLAMAKRI